MKLANIIVSSRLKDNPAAIFKVNHLNIGEDEKSLILSSLNGKLSPNFSFRFTFIDAHDSSTKQYRSQEPLDSLQFLEGISTIVLTKQLLMRTW